MPNPSSERLDELSIGEAGRGVAICVAAPVCKVGRVSVDPQMGFLELTEALGRVVRCLNL